MKKKITTLINLLILCMLVIGNIILLNDKAVTNDSILMLVFAIIFLLIYIWGVVFPNLTVKFIYQISLKLYETSENIIVPSFVEAKRTFLKRLIYFLVCSNICLFLSLLLLLRTLFGINQ